MSLSAPSTTMAVAAAAAAASASAISRTQRCGVCEGCLAKACGSCVYCKDNPQFGGPGVKKQSCVARRCVRVLEGKLQREAMSSRAKKGCGVCDECRDTDCGACLVCMDRRFFQGQFLPDALCAKKKCSNPRPLEPNPLSPKLAPSLTTLSDKKSKHSYLDTNVSLNGSSRKTPGSAAISAHLSHYHPIYGGNEGKKKKLENNFGSLINVPSTSASLRPNVPSVFAQTAGPQSNDPVTLMERAFSYVIHHQPTDNRLSDTSSSAAAMLRHPTMLVQPRHHQVAPSAASGNGASPPAGTTAPVYRSLPVATPLVDVHAAWNPQNSKVLYPTSIEAFTSAAASAIPVSNEGYIVTLDSDQLKQHLSGNSTATSNSWSSINASSGDAEDIELQQKLIEFYQRDKQQQQSNQQYLGIGGITNQGQYHSGQNAVNQNRNGSSLPPSIVAEPIAPMGQSEVVLQQL